MKVGGSSDSNPLEKLGRSGSRGSANGSKATATTTASDSVSFSDLSSRLQELEKTLATSEEFDAGRVESIKQAIRDGQFLVDSGVVADKLLQSVQELLGATA